MKSYSKILLQGIYPFFTVLAIILLFGPIIIYVGNINEFSALLKNMFLWFLLIIIIFVLIGGVLYLLLPLNLRKYWISCLTFLAVLLWIQGNLLVWKYGLFDGQGILYQYVDWRGFDVLIWIVLLAVTIRWAKKLAPFSPIICTALLLVQISYASFLVYENAEAIKGRRVYSFGVPREIVRFSDARNIIHIILDAFQSDLFEKILNSNYAYFEKKLDGFTFFRDTVASFPTTYMSLPAIFRGVNYKNDISMNKFFTQSFENSTFLNLLGDNGYTLESCTTGMTGFTEVFEQIYHVPKPFYATKLQLEIAETLSILDFCLFRYLPHIGKGLVYNHEKWCFQNLHSKAGLIYYPVNHARFFEKYIAATEVVPKKPTYKFFHLFISHAPLVLNADCEYIGKVVSPKEEYDDRYVLPQLTCSLRQCIMLFDRLKEMGIYNNCMIILQADHGYGKPVDIKTCDEKALQDSHLSRHIIACALPLLAIKPFNSTGNLRISNVQASLTDIPATLMSQLRIKHHFPGQSVFELDENEQREREFLYYVWRHELWQGDYFDKLEQFSVRGPAIDQFSWTHAATYYPRGEVVQHRRDGITHSASRLKTFRQRVDLVGFLDKQGMPGRLFFVPAGGNVALVISVKNTTTETWFAKGSDEQGECNRIRLGCYWLDQAGTRLGLEGYGLLPINLDPGEAVILKADVPVPKSPGQYTLCCTMVQECIAWFDSEGGKPLEIAVKVE